MGLIYKYTNIINNKTYIGQTRQSLEERHKKHLQQSKNNPIDCFHRAIKKYGIENFTKEIVEDDIPNDKLNEREIYWISYFDSYYISGRGYNMTKGGQWGDFSPKNSRKSRPKHQSFVVRNRFII